MTATEVIQRTEEKMRLLGPLTGRLSQELLQPLITRVYSILSRQKAFAPAPDFMTGSNLEIIYVSPLAKAQRQGDIQSMTRLLELMTPLSQLDPSIMDYVDSDGMGVDRSASMNMSGGEAASPSSEVATAEAVTVAIDEDEAQDKVVDPASELALVTALGKTGTREMVAALLNDVPLVQVLADEVYGVSRECREDVDSSRHLIDDTRNHETGITSSSISLSAAEYNARAFW